MSSSKKTKKSSNVNPTNWIFIGLTIVTLYFQSNLADPFNSPKSWLIMLISAWLIGYIWHSRKILYSEFPIKLIAILVLFFIVSSLLSTLFSDNIYISIFGETMRKNGLLSYASLAIIMLASAMFVRNHNVNYLFKVSYLIGYLSVIYGFLQANGKDFISWNNPYNPVITTLGNPNFAASLMAILGILIFSTLFMSKSGLKLRIFGGILCLSILYVIFLSNARQGLLVYLIGLGIFLNILLLGKNKYWGAFSVLLSSFCLFLAVLGMLQIGPLASLIYKGSVSVRGFYWRAGVEMFRDNLVVGVGMDRYGTYFKQYRETEYVLRHGFEITSNNAHNTFIQFFATGGLLLGASYLLLNVYIFRRAIIALRSNLGQSRLNVAGIISAWIGFHAQSLISIDNVGLSIWGWVLGGTIVGLSLQKTDSLSNSVNSGLNNKIQRNDSGRLIVSSVSTLFTVILVSVLFVGEVRAMNSMQTIDTQSEQVAREGFKNMNLSTINSPLIDPIYKLTAATRIIQVGYIDEGLAVIEEISEKDPRNLDALNSLASIYEQMGKLSLAIEAREKIVNLDPWNALNFLELGKDYKTQGNQIRAQQMLKKIITFAPNHPIASQAKAVLDS